MEIRTKDFGAGFEAGFEAGPQNQQVESGVSLGPVLSPPSTFFSCAKRINVSQTNTELAIGASNKEAPTSSPKIIQFQVPKTNPKLAQWTYLS